MFYHAKHALSLLDTPNHFLPFFIIQSARLSAGKFSKETVEGDFALQRRKISRNKTNVRR